jgi:MFS family permease
MVSTDQVNKTSRSRAVFSYLIVALFLFFEMGVQVSPSVMTSQLQKTMSIGAFGLGLMSGFYFYTYTLMQIPSGMIFDRFKPRYVISTAILMCSLGCLAFGLSNNIVTGSIGRMLMGFGSAFAFVAVLVVTADLFPKKYFAFITGITQMLAAFGAMAGQIPLSYTVIHLGWKPTMFLLSGIGIVLAITVWLILNYNKANFSYQKPQAKLPFKTILANKQSWFIAIYSCLLWAPMSGFASLWGVPFLEHVYSFSKPNAAIVCSMAWLGLALASPALGYLSTEFKTRNWPLRLTALFGFIAFGALLTLNLSSTTLIMAIVFISGAACSGQALAFTVVKEINAPQQRATAIAFNNMAVVISGAIFQPVLGRLLEFHCNQKGALLHTCQAHHYRLSMLLVLGAYAIAFIIAAFFIKESWEKNS